MSDECIVEKCKASWDEEFIPPKKNSDNCSGFAKAVAAKLGVTLPNVQADGIVEYISGNWTKLDSGAEAAKEAGLGYLVIAGLKGADHTPARSSGHVAIVVTGRLYLGKYPLCWGGSTGVAQSRGDKSTGEVWARSDRNNVEYYAYKTAQVCKA